MPSGNVCELNARVRPPRQAATGSLDTSLDGSARCRASCRPFFGAELLFQQEPQNANLSFYLLFPSFLFVVLQAVLPPVFSLFFLPYLFFFLFVILYRHKKKYSRDPPLFLYFSSILLNCNARTFFVSSHNQDAMEPKTHGLTIPMSVVGSTNRSV